MKKIITSPPPPPSGLTGLIVPTDIEISDEEAERIVSVEKVSLFDLFWCLVARILRGGCFEQDLVRFTDGVLVLFPALVYSSGRRGHSEHQQQGLREHTMRPCTPELR